MEVFDDWMIFIYKLKTTDWFWPLVNFALLWMLVWAALLGCTFAWFAEANVVESYTIACNQACQKNEYKTGCSGASTVGKSAAPATRRRQHMHIACFA
jgi:hypothetical protein